MAGRKVKKKKYRKVAIRRSVTGAGTFAAATVALLGQAGTAVAAPPKYAQGVSAYSHAIDNTAAGATQAAKTLNIFWAPLAADAEGVLPSFSAGSQKVDMTDISNFPDVVRAIAQVPMPTAVPGVIPQVKIPGQGFVTLPVPTSLPGADMLVGFADGLDAIYNVPGVEWVVGSVPPLSELIPGLEATQETYHSGFAWPVLGIAGATSVSNTYVQTPGSPSITADLPVAQGVYTLPLEAAAGWWASAPTLAVSDPDFVVSLPMGAVGLQAPGGLGQAGVFGVSAVLPSANGLYLPVGATISNVAVPGLGLGATNLNLTTGNYVGTDGINLNNGQNMLVIQTPLTGAIPLPVVYSLGGFNMGPSGVGYTAPSLYGVSLVSPVQVGSAPTGSGDVGSIPADLIPVGDIMPTQLISASGLASAILGVKDPSVAVGQGLTPAYDAVVGPAAQQVSNMLTQQYGPVVDALGSTTLQASQTFKELTDWLGGINAATPPLLQPETAPVALDSAAAPTSVTPELRSTRVVPDANVQQVAANDAVAVKDTTTNANGTKTKAEDPTTKPAPGLTSKPDKALGANGSHNGTKNDREPLRGGDGRRDGIKSAVKGPVSTATEKLNSKMSTLAPNKKPTAIKKPGSASAGAKSSSTTSKS